jgi:membrane protein implicated in regulation of membrane protease activity
MIPPTPTFLPSPGIPAIDLSNVYDLWMGAPIAVQVWNMSGMGGAVQLVALLAIVLVGVYVVYRFLRDFVKADEQE